MFWKERIEKKIREICEFCNEFQSDMRHISNCLDNKLYIKDHDIQNYIDITNKLQLENNELRAKVEEYKFDADKHYEDVGTISGLQNVIEDYKSQLSDYEILKKQNETLTKQIEHLQTTIKILDPLVKSQDETINFLKEQKNTSEANLTELRNCFSAVLRGMYDREEIEFAALKTYRGWKFIYSNGVTTEDFSNTNSVEISWNNGEFVKLSINN